MTGFPDALGLGAVHVARSEVARVQLVSFQRVFVQAHGKADVSFTLLPEVPLNRER